MRKSGVLIGRVTDVQLTDDDPKVLVTAGSTDKTIYQNEVCYITRDLLGDTAMSFIPQEDDCCKARQLAVQPKRSRLGPTDRAGTILEGYIPTIPPA